MKTTSRSDRAEIRLPANGREKRKTTTLASAMVAALTPHARSQTTTTQLVELNGFDKQLEAQNTAGKHFSRPRDAKALAKWPANFPEINLVGIEREFGGWAKARKTHFDGGGTFSQIYQK